MLSRLPLSRACFFVIVSGTVTPLHAFIAATAFSFLTYVVLESRAAVTTEAYMLEVWVTVIPTPGHWPFSFLASGKWILKYHTHPVSPGLKTFLCRHGKRYTFTPTHLHTSRIPRPTEEGIVGATYIQSGSSARPQRYRWPTQPHCPGSYLEICTRKRICFENCISAHQTFFSQRIKKCKESGPLVCHISARTCCSSY